MIFDHADAAWRATGERLGWKLPPPAPLWKRLPIIRCIRWTIVALQVDRHYSENPIGIPTGYDDWVLYAIRRGFC